MLFFPQLIRVLYKTADFGFSCKYRDTVDYSHWFSLNTELLNEGYYSIRQGVTKGQNRPVDALRVSHHLSMVDGLFECADSLERVVNSSHGYGWHLRPCNQTGGRNITAYWSRIPSGNVS
jgi:hypothetical protein